MGLSIHYSGKIKNIEDIDFLTKEVTDICQSMDWNYTLVDNKTDQLKGIVFSPENSEMICLTFLPDGTLCSPVHFILKDLDEDYAITPDLQWVVSTKTQYAGMQAHMAVIKFLKYIDKKYFSDFQLQDEGMYWETGDEAVLKSQFSKYEMALEIVTTALENIEIKPGESSESLADRIEKILTEKLGRTDQDIQRLSLD